MARLRRASSAHTTSDNLRRNADRRHGTLCRRFLFVRPRVDAGSDRRPLELDKKPPPDIVANMAYAVIIGLLIRLFFDKGHLVALPA